MNNLSILIISGLSGAGKTTVANVLEDIGYDKIDNMPLQVIEKIIDLLYTTEAKMSKVAFVIDSRAKDRALVSKTIALIKEKYNATLLFVEASEATLVKRYKETRRKHPRGDDIVEAIKDEMALMSDVKDMADIVFNSDQRSVHELTREVQDYFKDVSTQGLFITVQSFGFKYGVPVDPDIMFDVRFLRNPFFVEGLKEKTGLDSEVDAYVKGDENYDIFLQQLCNILLTLIPLYKKENKKYLNIAIGCTGGKHRSVSMVESIAQVLASKSQAFVRTKHRDIEK